MREVATGVWHWKAPHPEWKPGQTSEQMVSSDAVDTGQDVLLFDPLEVPPELRERATAVLLTCPWHLRDAPQLGLPIHVPPPDPPAVDVVLAANVGSGLLSSTSQKSLSPNRNP